MTKRHTHTHKRRSAPKVPGRARVVPLPTVPMTVQDLLTLLEREDRAMQVLIRGGKLYVAGNVVEATAHFDLYQDARGEYRWRLVAANGRALADSGEGYTTEAAARHGILLVKQVVENTRVQKLVPPTP